MAPQALVQLFTKTGGTIEGCTATFGAPFFGDRVLGRLVYGESKKSQRHCTNEDYDAPQAQTATSSRSGDKEVRLINIMLVRRGDCSFTTKVKVAEAKGAYAVIIVDKEDSELTARDMHNIIVADDGNGRSIQIPSVLISKEDGRLLIEEAKRSEVIVELAWNLPTNHTVQTDLWMSSASKESLRFLKELALKRRILNRVMAFTPHFAVFGMNSVDQSTANSLCSDMTGRYCAEDPDGPGPVTGKDVLAEDVRQLCIHQLYKRSVYSDNIIDHAAKQLEQQTREAWREINKIIGVPTVEFAAEFWAYIERFAERCPLEKFGLECSQQLMAEVGIDPAKIEACVQWTGEAMLAKERRFTAWSPRALRINGWRYSGAMDANLVTRAICSSFVEKPKECEELVKPRDPFVPFKVGEQGVSFGTLFSWLFCAVALSAAALLLYKRYLKKEMRATLREEVMLEVQAQIGEYSRLSGR